MRAVTFVSSRPDQRIAGGIHKYITQLAGDAISLGFIGISETVRSLP
jgi:hypothetical protein